MRAYLPLLLLLGGCWPLLPGPHVPFADDDDGTPDTVETADTDDTVGGTEDTDVVPTDDCPEGIRTTYKDDDGDGFGDDATAKETCGVPAGRAAEGGDCDETSDAVNPDAAEVCGGGDEDCDSRSDDADSDVDASTQKVVWPDADGDGLGDPAGETRTCLPSPDQVKNGDDCDDSTADVGEASDHWTDGDADGYGDGASVGLVCPAVGLVAAGGSIDCDDGDAAFSPGAVDVCGDGLDQNCAAGDQKCKVLGAFDVGDGPDWFTDPPVQSCLETCAMLLGGTTASYQCSTTSAFVDNLAFMSGYGDPKYCTVGRAEDFKKEDPANPGYDCGAYRCSYSTWVGDQCSGAINYCWTR